MSKSQKMSRSEVRGLQSGGEEGIPSGYLPHIIRQFPPNCKLRTYPDLSAFALKERLDLALRLWYLLRQGCPDGRGWILEGEVFRFSCGNRRQTRRWLAQGEGIFWHRADGRLWLHGLEKVSLALDVKPRKAPVMIPAEDIEDLGRFRAALFASWFADRPRTISQRRLGEIFGRTDRTLRTWVHLAGVEVGHNLAWAPLPDSDILDKYPLGTMRALGIKTVEEEAGRSNNVWIERWSALPGEKNWNCQNYRKGGRPVLVWRLPNTYRSDFERGPMTRLQRAALQALSSAITSRANVRLFFERGPGQATKAARALEREPHVAFAEERVTHYGYGLWSFNAV